MQSDFIPVRELAQRTGFAVKSLYNQHTTGHGALAEILTRLGSKVGCWEEDYRAFVARQRRIKDQAA